MLENNTNSTNNYIPPPIMDYELPPADRFAEEISTCNKLVVGLLAFFLGSIGVHNFYAGNKKRGIIMLVCTLSGIFVPITGVLWIIDMVKLVNGNFTDGQGRVIK